MILHSHVAQLRALSTIATRFPRESFNTKLSDWMQKYEDIVGLSDVKSAQSRVLQVFGFAKNKK